MESNMFYYGGDLVQPGCVFETSFGHNRYEVVRITGSNIEARQIPSGVLFLFSTSFINDCVEDGTITFSNPIFFNRNKFVSEPNAAFLRKKHESR